MGARRRCCCRSADCWWFEDNFNQDNTTNLGTDWNEVTGDWGIEDRHLVEKYGGGGTSSAKVFCTQPIPEREDNGMYVRVRIVDPPVGGIYYIFVCCEDDETVGVEVKFERLDPDDWEITIDGGGANGTVQQEASYVDGTDVIAWVCADHMAQMVKAGVISPSDAPAWSDTLDPGDGRYAGLGHDNDGETEDDGAIFDDFFMIEMRTETEACNDCWCWCELLALKRTVTATIVDAVDRASCLDGESWEMEWEWNAGVPRWKGTGYFYNKETDEHDIAVTYVLTCSADANDPDHPGKHFGLEAISGACDAVPGMKGNRTPLATSKCQPLKLVFGPYSLSWSDLS